MKEKIFREEKITCSIGIAQNKLVAKMASKVKKPDGLTLIKPEEVKGFLSPLPVKKLFGVGPKSLEVFEKLGVKTISDLAKTDVKVLVDSFGENKGNEIWERANGIDDSPVEETERQQLARIGTLKENTNNLGSCKFSDNNQYGSIVLPYFQRTIVLNYEQHRTIPSNTRCLTVLIFPASHHF